MELILVIILLILLFGGGFGYYRGGYYSRGWLWHRRDTGGCPDRVAAARPSWRLLKPSSEHGAKPMTFTLNAALLQPIVALIAGILILLIPRILNFIVAIYLIFVGVTGLWPHLLSAVPH
jgi:Protein of unknown function (DUF3096)